MSAAEIIEEIRKRPVSGQKQVPEFLQHRGADRTSEEATIRYARDEEFDRTANQVLNDPAEELRRVAEPASGCPFL